VNKFPIDIFGQVMSAALNIVSFLLAFTTFIFKVAIYIYRTAKFSNKLF
jgi:hypothetical protein